MAVAGSLKVTSTKMGNRQFSYKRLVPESGRKSEKKTNKMVPERPPPPSVAQLIDISPPGQSILDQPISQHCM